MKTYCNMSDQSDRSYYDRKIIEEAVFFNEAIISEKMSW